MANLNVSIIGASGGIGSAFVSMLSQDPTNTVHAFSRSALKNERSNVQLGTLDFADEGSISAAAQAASENRALDLVIVATGILHDATMMPEKTLADLSADNFQRNFLANTIGPALVAKHFLPKLQRDKRAVFAALSARVGSISDNRLGGWYAYRASKAALNMLIRTASIEVARRHKHAIVVGMHPGTVATNLSQPFQARVPSGKLFEADYSAGRLIAVMAGLTPNDSGKVFAWDGSEVPC
ncbi:NAD(P)-dependent dehydrogenase, short-chain alcohol dehydrogenase family [Alteromonadaceae bacterium Bs31]|nr:NAD(P)-dependent dehydrogenase, short-chain alcohol dehydrogenase family [Alteromonadaceae bacterium Bs31]